MNLSVSALRGRKVSNYDNEYLGEIEDLMLDSVTGEVEYALLSSPAIDGKLFPVPLRALTVDTEAGLFTLNADREVLRHAPGFHRDRWPDIRRDIRNPRWKSGIRSYYSF